MTTFATSDQRTAPVLPPTVADIDHDAPSPSPSKAQQPQPVGSNQGTATTSNTSKTNGTATSSLDKLLNKNSNTAPPSTPSIKNLVNPTQPTHHNPTQKPQTTQSPYPPRWQTSEYSEGIVRTTVGGKMRLTKRTPTKALLLDDEGEDDAMDGHKGAGAAKAQGGPQNGHHETQTRGSEEEVDEEMGEDVDALDLTAPVAKFDSQTELVAHWNQLQSELWPYLKRWGETRISEAELSVRRVYYEVHQMTTQVRDELEKGVKNIEEQEAQHERAREMIRDFQNDLKRASARMGNFASTLE